jgi:hypothetical protein
VIDLEAVEMAMRSALRAPQGGSDGPSGNRGKTPRTQAKSKNRRDHKTRKNRKETLRRIYNLGGAKADDRKGPTRLTKPKEVYYNSLCAEVAAEALRKGAWSLKSGREVCACGRIFFPSYDVGPVKVV